MTDEEQEARALKFEPRGSVTLRRLASGRFAMYPLGGIGTPFWIGDATGIESAYAARPEPQKVARPTPVPSMKAERLGVTFNL